MPCRTYEDEENRARGVQDKLDKVTDLLCSTCKKLLSLCNENLDSTVFMSPAWSPALIAWWTEHRKQDIKRLSKAKESGLAKLTPDEKEALGLS